MTGDNGLVAETKALIAEVEAGETKHAAWVAIQDRVKLLCEDRSQAEVGRLLDKHGSWVSKLLQWEQGESRPTPFGGDFPATANRDVVGARSVIRDPEKRKQLVESLPPEDRDELLHDVWKETDKEVAADPQTKRVNKDIKRKLDDPREALAHTRRAFQNLGARIHLYGDVPLQENPGYGEDGKEEEALLRYISRMADGLLRGAAMDDDLQEMIEDEQARQQS